MVTRLVWLASLGFIWNFKHMWVVPYFDLVYIKSDHAILGIVAQPCKNVVLHSWDTWLAFVERPELLIEEITNSRFEFTNPTILEFEESYT